MKTRGTITLVLGGIRSGKSAYGEGLLAHAPAVRYVATGPVLTSDADWVARVDAHRNRRDERYTTVETSDLAAELRADPASATIVDDLGNWLAARLDATEAWSHNEVDRSAENAELCSAIGDFTGDLVLISPEAGLAPVAPTPAGRLFQDELGRVNAEVAAVADRVVLVVAGRVLELGDPARQPIESGTEHVSAVGVSGAESAPATDPLDAIESTPRTDEPTVDSSSTTSTGTTSTREDTDADTFTPITPPDASIADAARARQRELTKPAGSLGRLEDIGVWIASCQGVNPPRPITAPAVVVFSGDHGVAQGNVSAFPPEVTAQMVANIAGGGAAVSVLARRYGASVKVVDMSVNVDTAPEFSEYKVRRGSNDLRTADALSLDETRRAIAAGRAIADGLVDSGADLLIAGDMGIGNTTPAAIIIGTLARREPVEVVGRGTGIDDLGWMRKTAAIREGMRRARARRSHTTAMLGAVGGADLAAMAGFLAQAAVRRTPAILDGVVVTSAAMIAAELAPGATRWWLAGHRSVEPAHTIALEYLDLEPVVDFGMRLGEGTGALVALPTVVAAVDILANMSTFGEAGVSESESSDPGPDASESDADDS